MSFKTAEFVISADVADAGTFTVNYPTGTNRGDFEFAMGHYMTINGTRYNQPEDIGLSFGTSAVTVTNRSGGTIPATGRGFFNFARAGHSAAIKGRNGVYQNTAKRTNEVKTVIINLGAPIVGDVDGLVTGYTGAAGAIPLNGALVGSDGIAVLDVPRCIVVDSGGADTSVITITGTDEYGRVMKENITTNGTTAVNGVKAFKTVTGISGSLTAANGIFIGTTNILGLPIHVPKATVGYILKELQDDAVATAGTVVAGLARNTESTATTADVRGTYLPNATPDGAKAFSLVVVVPDPEYQGNPQYAG